MKKWFSWIPMTLFLLAIWLLLAAMPLGLGTALLGFAASLVIVLMSRRLRPVLARPRKLGVICRLVGTVIADTLHSNLAILKLNFSRHLHYQPGFITVPLSIHDPHGLAILASIINYAPGTVWAGLAEDGQSMQLHILHLPLESDWVAFIKNRYEQPLMEIFESWKPS